MASDPQVMKTSPLNDEHVRLGGRMVSFSGWSMPVQFSGIMAEHKAVREAAGVFDISHMGQFVVEGAGAEAWLDRMLANRVAKLQAGEGQYSFILNENGGIIDDLIIYRRDAESFFLVVNAAKSQEDFTWLSGKLPDGDVSLLDESEQFGALAVQGPKAPAIFARAFARGPELPKRNGIHAFHSDDGDELIVCRTGYTGEDGFEFFCPAASSGKWLHTFLDAGADLGVQPCGLGARDSLRLEMCYPLNGSDLSPSRTPLQAGLGFFVDLEKPDFIGREALIRQKEKGLGDRLAAILMTAKGPPPRPHCALFHNGTKVGELCSGGLSPTLGQGIGLAYLPVSLSKVDTEIEIDIRGRKFAAKVVKKPFVKK